MGSESFKFLDFVMLTLATDTSNQSSDHYYFCYEFTQFQILAHPLANMKAVLLLFMVISFTSFL